MPGFTGGLRHGKALFIAETVWSWARAWYLLITMAIQEKARLDEVIKALEAVPTTPLFDDPELDRLAYEATCEVTGLSLGWTWDEISPHVPTRFLSAV